MILAETYSPQKQKNGKQSDFIVNNEDQRDKFNEFDEKDIGVKLNRQSSDAIFEVTFNRDINVNLNEVSVVIFELHENSLLYMDREEWDRALLLLRKAQVLIEKVNLEAFK